MTGFIDSSMCATTDPNLVVGGCAVGGMVIFLFWRLIVWVRDAPVTPDPWDAAVAQQLADPETKETCPHCSTPQEPGTWFCEHCGCAVGPYNNLMPYLNVFSEGEVLRNGVSGRFRNRPLILAGFILISISSYLVFAPVYLFCLLGHWWRPASGTESAE